LNIKTYNQIREDVFKQINDIIKADTVFEDINNIDDYINYFKDLRNVSKTEINTLDNIIRQLENYRTLFTKEIDVADFKKHIKPAIRFYGEAVNEAYSETQADNIAKGMTEAADMQTKLKTVKQAEKESIAAAQEQLKRVETRDAQIAAGINTISENDTTIRNSVPVLKELFKTMPEQSVSKHVFAKDLRAYYKAYKNHFEVIHAVDKTSSDVLKSQMNLIDAYNHLFGQRLLNIKVYYTRECGCTNLGVGSKLCHCSVGTFCIIDIVS
jgi:hypothetical protein